MFLFGKLFNWRRKKGEDSYKEIFYSNNRIKSDATVEDFAEAIERDLSGNNGYECKQVTHSIESHPLEINDDDILLDEIIETSKSSIKPAINRFSYQLKDVGYTLRQNYLEEEIISTKFALAGERATIESICTNLDQMLEQDWKHYERLSSEDILFIVKRLYEKAETIIDAYNDGGKNYLKATVLADKFTSTAKKIEARRNINYKSPSRIEQLVS